MTNQNYLNTKTNQISTEAWLKACGINVSNPEVLKALGYVPVTYEYQEFDSWTQAQTPDGAPKLNKSKTQATQKFKVTDLTGEALQSSLDRFKDQLKADLNSKWLDAEANATTEVILQSGETITIDSNERANRDVQGLVTILENTGTDTASFCAADNSFHSVTLADLKNMQIAIITYGQNLYAKKWVMRNAIEEAPDFATARAIEISFEG